MNYNYNRVLKKDEVLVFLIDKLNIYHNLSEEIFNASERYGFTFINNLDSIDEVALENYIIRHAIIIDGIDTPKEISEKYHYLYDMVTSITLAISYSSENKFREAEKDINLLKKQYKKINYLLPTQDDKIYRPTLEKLVDNSICDSVRIKYKANKLSAKIDSFMSPEIEDYFKRVSNLIENLQLFHRASTDGFISLRLKENSFLITSTKTDKVNLDLQRISYVQDYDEETNILSYVGEYLPSSDSVEASILYSKMPNVNAILHTHASHYFTRNPLFSKKIAVPPMRYGEIELGHKVVKYFIETNAYDFAIMEDHGEVFLSESNSISQSFFFIKKTIENNIKSILI